MNKRFSQFRELNQFHEHERSKNAAVIMAPLMQKALQGLYRGLMKELTRSDAQAALALKDYERLQNNLLSMAGLHQEPWSVPYFAALLSKPYERTAIRASQVHFFAASMQEFQAQCANGDACKLFAPLTLGARYVDSERCLTAVPSIKVSRDAARELTAATWHPGPHRSDVNYTNGPMQPFAPHPGSVPAQHQDKFRF